MDLPTIPAKMPRPTITLAVICKNEEKNLPRFLGSFVGAVDEIVLVDTGSTDKSKEIALEFGAKVYDFEWVDSFCKARNFAFSKVTTDYVVWADCDDVLDNKEAFIKWRDHAMKFVDYWLNTYHYAVDEKLNPIISFVRERVFRMSIDPTWHYDLHEGVLPKAEWSKNYITTWSIKHLRDAEDMAQDRSRNIRMLDKMVAEGPLDPRLQFYYGKELWEAQRPQDAIPAFEKSMAMNLEPHDRLLACQYAGYATLFVLDQTPKEDLNKRNELLNKAIDFANQGLKLDPNRAEFHVLIADAYLRSGDISKAIPFFAAAKACVKNFDSPYAQPAFSFKNLYGEAPSIQLAKVYAHLGMLDKSLKEAKEAHEAYKSEEALQIINEVERVTRLVNVKQNQTQTEDIIFTCPPGTMAYEFDEELYKTKPMGGSETALIQMAKWLKIKTGRNVKVFNGRQEVLVAESGVEYIPNSTLTDYVSKYKPRVNIAWRHNIKLTESPTYLWCHDLFTPTVEAVHNFEKILCLSEFSKNYVSGLQGVPDSKIVVTRNGIDPTKFQFEKKAKNPNKIVWMSSPDRGLERCMQVCDEVIKEFPEIELHVYYGIEGLYKYGPGMSALADKLKAMMAARPYVKYHGFTEQNKMYQEVSDAVIWNHPNNFIETFCITALECLANGIFPVVRRLGALADTLKEAEENRKAILLDYEWEDPEGIKLQANAICRALLNRQWENVKDFDFEHHSWQAIADEWIEFMGLGKAEVKTA